MATHLVFNISPILVKDMLSMSSDEVSMYLSVSVSCNSLTTWIVKSYNFTDHISLVCINKHLGFSSSCSHATDSVCLVKVFANGPVLF